MNILRWLRGAGLLLLGLFVSAAGAEPYLALQQGYRCSNCHANGTGGGLRTNLGTLYAQTGMAASPMPAGAPLWNGQVGDFVRLGGDLRAAATWTRVPTQPARREVKVDQLRLYGEVRLLGDRLGLYVDEALAPGAAELKEAFVRWSADGWTLKGGQFYLPFGWRLQDNTAFVREASGINMAAPDTGVELGWENDAWSMHLALSKGPGNAGAAGGSQLTGQVVWLQPWGRIGAAAAATRADAGNREAAAIFAGLRTGPLTWLIEVDGIRDAGFPEGRRTLLATLAEVNWQPALGHNLKLSGETFDPDRNVREDQRSRLSLVYEFTPMPFVQLRAGWRRWQGIPQSNVDNRRSAFVELHGFF